MESEYLRLKGQPKFGYQTIQNDIKLGPISWELILFRKILLKQFQYQ